MFDLCAVLSLAVCMVLILDANSENVEVWKTMGLSGEGKKSDLGTI